MDEDQYQGFTVRLGRPFVSEYRDAEGCWFHVARGHEDAFDLKMLVDSLYAFGSHRGKDEEALAKEYGRTWVHGLIDLNRFEPGKTYNEIRPSDWNPLFGESTVTDEDIRRELLQALRRMHHAQQNTSVVLGIDVDGIAAVLGVRPDRVRGVLAELLLEGLVEPCAADLERRAVDGRCRITREGLRELRAIESRARATASTPVSVAADQPTAYEYDVAISFAGTERPLAEQLATVVRDAGYRVFYDDFYPEQLWGKDLPVFFDEIYRLKSRYCVIFVSAEYNERIWTNHERQSAIARQIQQRGSEYILPIKVEEVNLPGMSPTIGYRSLERDDIEKIGQIIIRKLQTPS